MGGIETIARNGTLERVLSMYPDRPVIFGMQNDLGYWKYYQIVGVVQKQIIDTPVLQLEYRYVTAYEIMDAGRKTVPIKPEPPQNTRHKT